MQEKNEGSAEGGRGKRSKRRQGRRLKEQLPDMHNQAPGMPASQATGSLTNQATSKPNN